MIDTTVTNGRFVGTDSIAAHAISIHQGVVLDAPEFEQVWRTIDASGHLVFPGMIQPGTIAGSVPLQLARTGTTTILLAERPATATPIDHAIATGRVVHPGEAGAIDTVRAGKAILEIPAPILEDPDWLAVANDESLAVHVTHGQDTAFPLLQFLYHTAKLTPARIAAVTSRIPARWYGLHPEKGSYRPGSHGDVVVFDPDTVDPYREGGPIGRVILSMQRGEMLLYNGQLHPPVDAGKLITS